MPKPPVLEIGLIQIIAALGVLVLGLGVLAPNLISAKSNIAVILGASTALLSLYAGIGLGIRGIKKVNQHFTGEQS